MAPDQQAEFQRRVSRLRLAEAITFDARIETLMERAAGIVAMGGYNTFCEILSFDKPALIVPRMRPRREQFIRASRAADLGLATMLVDDGDRAPQRMAEALRRLPKQPVPSSVAIPGLLDGLDTVNRLASRWLHPSGTQPALTGSHR
jgi:predicted glycosyltransferase